MKKLVTFFIMLVLIINITCTCSNAMEVNSEEYIKVKLMKPLKSNNIINLQSERGFIICSIDEEFKELDRLENQQIIVTLGENDLLDIKDINDNIFYSFANTDNIYIFSIDDYDSTIKVEEDRYRDYLTFNRVGNVIDVINYVSLNHYLYGVVPMEMPSTFPLEALKAQAIAARNFTLANINKHLSSGYNLCDSADCQVYGGYDRETENTNLSVDETDGIVIKYKGEIVNATYHSNSGGYTENCEDVWGASIPYLKAVNDEFSKESPNTDWKIIFTNEDIQGKLLKIGIDIGEIESLIPIDKTEAGRVITLKVVGTKGEHVLEKNEIRQVFGYSEIKSNLFNISTMDVSSDLSSDSGDVVVIDGMTGKPVKVKTNNIHVINGDEKRTIISRGSYSRALTNNGVEEVKRDVYLAGKQFVIEGKGYGHGVGMSQWGARNMAELGHSYEDILKHYYSGIELTTEYK